MADVEKRHPVHGKISSSPLVAVENGQGAFPYQPPYHVLTYAFSDELLLIWRELREPRLQPDIDETPVVPISVRAQQGVELLRGICTMADQQSE